MSFSLERMREMAEAGAVARVVVAETRGSVPREVGAEMLVTSTTTEGTIGGGALEFEAIARARRTLRSGTDCLDRVPLGPSLGQCCGGSVTVLTEVWDQNRLSEIDGDVVSRALPGKPDIVPLAVERVLARVRNAGVVPAPSMIDGWMVEPVTYPDRQIWIWGAGHVGRAIVGVLAPLPRLRLFWADTAQDRFPTDIPSGVEQLVALNPSDLVTFSGQEAEHLVLTYSHALDLELCHQILSRPFRSLGVIGSETKWARFRKRLAELGHSDAQISRIACPIGDPGLGKHPQAIALGVATVILGQATGEKSMTGTDTGARA